jgi:predicted nucleotidyltransferase
MRRNKFRLPRKKIAEFCKRWSITEFSVFGSVLREDFRADSDIDVLVTIDPNAQFGLLDMAQMQIELE